MVVCKGDVMLPTRLSQSRVDVGPALAVGSPGEPLLWGNVRFLTRVDGGWGVSH